MGRWGCRGRRAIDRQFATVQPAGQSGSWCDRGRAIGAAAYDLDNRTRGCGCVAGRSAVRRQVFSTREGGSRRRWRSPKSSETTSSPTPCLPASAATVGGRGDGSDRYRAAVEGHRHGLRGAGFTVRTNNARNRHGLGSWNQHASIARSRFRRACSYGFSRSSRQSDGGIGGSWPQHSLEPCGSI